MRITLTLDVDEETGLATVVSSNREQPAGPLRPVSFPSYFDGHRFETAAALDDYVARVAERNANLGNFEAVRNAEGARWYRGPIDPATLTPEDWAIVTQHPHLWNRGDIWARRPSGWAAGQDNANNAQTVDVAAYKAKGGILAPYL